MNANNYSAGIAQVSRLIWHTYSKAPYSEAADPKYFIQNLTVGAEFLKHNYNHYRSWRLALASYNEGETITDKVLAGKRSFSPITQRYISGVNN